MEFLYTNCYDLPPYLYYYKSCLASFPIFSLTPYQYVLLVITFDTYAYSLPFEPLFLLT